MQLEAIRALQKALASGATTFGSDSSEHRAMGLTLQASAELSAMGSISGSAEHSSMGWASSSAEHSAMGFIPPAAPSLSAKAADHA